MIDAVKLVTALNVAKVLCGTRRKYNMLLPVSPHVLLYLNTHIYTFATLRVTLACDQIFSFSRNALYKPRRVLIQIDCGNLLTRIER